MAVRRWVVRPDEEIQTVYGIEEVLSRDALVEAFVDAALVIDRMGGGVTIVSGRSPTGLEGEMVTTGLMFEWKSSSKTRIADEQPFDLPQFQQQETREEDDPMLSRLGTDEPEAEPAADDEAEALARLEEEDVSSIPEHAR